MNTPQIPAKFLDDITECSICTETYEDPRVLPCIHTYCLRCIAKHCQDKQPGDEVACPLCRKEFVIPDNGVDDLPSNFFMGNLMTMKKLSVAGEDAVKACDVCSAGSRRTDSDSPGKLAKWRCLDCQENLCETCHDVHSKMKITRSHRTTRVSVDDEEDDEETVQKTANNNNDNVVNKCASPPSRSYCEKHADESIKIYCSDCRTVSCMMCYIELHNGHKCSDVNKAVDEFRAQLTADANMLAERADRYRDMIARVEERRARFTVRVEETERQVCDRAEKLKASIESGRIKLIDELNGIKKTRLKEMQSARSEIEQMLRTVEGSRKHAVETMSGGTASDIIREARSVRQRFEQLSTNTTLQAADLERSISDDGVTFSPSSDLNPDDIDRMLGKVIETTKSSHVDVVVTVDTPAELATLTLAHVIPRGSNSAAVGSVAVLDSRVFVGRYGIAKVEVYVVENLSSLSSSSSSQSRPRQLLIAGLGPTVCGLAASDTANCLYVADSNNNVVHKVRRRFEVAGCCRAARTVRQRGAQRTRRLLRSRQSPGVQARRVVGT